MSIREQITALITTITSSDANKMKSELCEAVLKKLLLLFPNENNWKLYPKLKNQFADVYFVYFKTHIFSRHLLCSRSLKMFSFLFKNP